MLAEILARLAMLIARHGVGWQIGDNDLGRALKNGKCRGIMSEHSRVHQTADEFVEGVSGKTVVLIKPALRFERRSIGTYQAMDLVLRGHIARDRVKARKRTQPLPKVRAGRKGIGAVPAAQIVSGGGQSSANPVRSQQRFLVQRQDQKMVLARLSLQRTCSQLH